LSNSKTPLPPYEVAPTAFTVTEKLDDVKLDSKTLNLLPFNKDSLVELFATPSTSFIVT
jgi:hypothetical protein